MLMLTVIVFFAAFLVAALVLSAAGNTGAQDKKHTLERLESVMMADAQASEDMIDLRKHELLSSIPLLNRLLLRLDIAPKLSALLAQAQVNWTPARLLLMSFVAFAAVAFLVHLRTDALLVSVVLGLAAASTPFLYVLFKRRKRFDKFEQGLPAAIDLIVSGLRSGHSLISALGLVAREAADPIGPEFRICFDEQNYGLELRTAMGNLVRRVPIEDVRIVITAILIQKETGGNLAEVLDKCAQVIRERFRLKKEIRVRTAQGRLTGLILTLLPLILGTLLYLINPDNMSLLWKRPIGLKMLYTAAGMTMVGGLIIRKIVRIRV